MLIPSAINDTASGPVPLATNILAVEWSAVSQLSQMSLLFVLSGVHVVKAVSIAGNNIILELKERLSFDIISNNYQLLIY